MILCFGKDVFRQHVIFPDIFSKLNKTALLYHSQNIKSYYTRRQHTFLCLERATIANGKLRVKTKNLLLSRRRQIRVHFLRKVLVSSSEHIVNDTLGNAGLLQFCNLPRGEMVDASCRVDHSDD